MAYSDKYMIDKCLEVIKKHKLVFFHEIFAFVKFCEATFYNRKLEQIESIKKAIEGNRIKIKKGLQKKWYDSKNSTTQVVLYKLLATDQEYERINTQKLDHASSDGSLRQFNVIVDSEETGESLKKLINKCSQN